MHIKIFILSFLFACFFIAFAENDNITENSKTFIAQNDTTDMSTIHVGQSETDDIATGLRSNGMIYIVVGVILIIVIGLLIYLSTLDKKITKLENEINNRRKLS